MFERILGQTSMGGQGGARGRGRVQGLLQGFVEGAVCAGMGARVAVGATAHIARPAGEGGTTHAAPILQWCAADPQVMCILVESDVTVVVHRVLAPNGGDHIVRSEFLQAHPADVGGPVIGFLQ